MVTSVLIQKHFTINRGFGGSCSTLGYSIGHLGGPVLVTYLIQKYGWRGSTLIAAGILAHIIVFGALYREPTEGRRNPGNVEIVHDVERDLTPTREKGASKERCEEMDAQNTVSDSSSMTNPEVVVPNGLRLTNELVDGDQDDKKTTKEPLFLDKERHQLVTKANQSQSEEEKENEKKRTADGHNQSGRNISESAMKSFVADVFDCSLCREYSLVIYCFCSMLCRYNLSVFLQHMPNKAVRLGMAKEDVAFLMSVFAISVICCRIIISFVANLKWINRMAMYGFGAILGGLGSLLTLIHSFSGFFVASLVHGVHLGRYLYPCFSYRSVHRLLRSATV